MSAFCPLFPQVLPERRVGGQTSDHVSLGMRQAQMQVTRFYSEKSVVKAAVLCYREFCLLAC